MISSKKSNLSQRRSKRWFLPVLLFVGTLFLVAIADRFTTLSSGIDYLISVVENAY